MDWFFKYLFSVFLVGIFMVTIGGFMIMVYFSFTGYESCVSSGIPSWKCYKIMTGPTLNFNDLNEGN